MKINIDEVEIREDVPVDQRGRISVGKDKKGKRVTVAILEIEDREESE